MAASIVQTKQHSMKPTNRKKDNGFIYSISLLKRSLNYNQIIIYYKQRVDKNAVARKTVPSINKIYQ